MSIFDHMVQCYFVFLYLQPLDLDVLSNKMQRRKDLTVAKKHKLDRLAVVYIFLKVKVGVLSLPSSNRFWVQIVCQAVLTSICTICTLLTI